MSKTTRTHVVVSQKPWAGGSRVMCGACSEADARDILDRLSADLQFEPVGPLRLATVAEAEKKKLYGE